MLQVFQKISLIPYRVTVLLVCASLNNIYINISVFSSISDLVWHHLSDYLTHTHKHIEINIHMRCDIQIELYLFRWMWLLGCENIFFVFEIQNVKIIIISPPVTMFSIRLCITWGKICWFIEYYWFIYIHGAYIWRGHCPKYLMQRLSDQSCISNYLEKKFHPKIVS